MSRGITSKQIIRIINRLDDSHDDEIPVVVVICERSNKTFDDLTWDKESPNSLSDIYDCLSHMKKDSRLNKSTVKVSDSGNVVVISSDTPLVVLCGFLGVCRILLVQYVKRIDDYFMRDITKFNERRLVSIDKNQHKLGKNNKLNIVLNRLKMREIALDDIEYLIVTINKLRKSRAVTTTFKAIKDFILYDEDIDEEVKNKLKYLFLEEVDDE